MRNLLFNIKYYWSLEHRNRVLGMGAAILFVGAAGMVISKVIQENNVQKELDCLARNIYHEARGESEAGQLAVGMVTMNRVRSDAYPNGVCKVVYQWVWDDKKLRNVSAFSWTTQTVDLAPQQDAWRSAVNIARQVYFGDATDNLDNALFYHADYVRPYWAAKKVRVRKIGRHIFYK